MLRWKQTRTERETWDQETMKPLFKSLRESKSKRD